MTNVGVAVGGSGVGVSVACPASAARWALAGVRTGTEVAHRSRWPYISLIPLGLGAWAPIYAGIKAHVLSWVMWGALWCAVVVAKPSRMVAKYSLSRPTR